MKKSIVINVAELTAEVQRLLVENAGDRLVPDSILQIGRIVEVMRLYKAAIVAANAPRGFDAGMEVNSTQQEILRVHRISAFGDNRPENGIRPINEWLLSLNTDFVLQGQPFRVIDSEWTILIWNPLFQWANRGFELIFGGKESHDWPKCLTLPVLQAWEDDELEIEFELFARMADFIPEGDWPIVDLQAGVLRWDSRETKSISPRDLRIIQCLVNKTGGYVDDDSICDAIDAPQMTAAAFRQTLSRLRRDLTKADFGDVASAIVRDKENGRMCLDHSLLLESLKLRHSDGK